MIIYYEHVDSTNRIAKELVMEGKPSGTVVRAGMQSAGKGQYGRSFNSPKGGLYFSLLLKPNLDFEHLPLVTLATGLACRKVIHSTFNVQSQIKWPNDIYLCDKKIAGILCENIDFRAAGNTFATVVIGVGLNVNNTREDFPLEIQSIITTLFDHLKIQVDLHSLLLLIVDEIIKNVLLLGENIQRILEQWQQYDYLYNKSVIYTAGSMTMLGTGLGISSQGYYRIRDNQGAEHCVVGGQLRLINDVIDAN
jgi:BirA family biotin operon repressor/biotin-[acetyl-CoA-carboxylase] ligase